MLRPVICLLYMVSKEQKRKICRRRRISLRPSLILCVIGICGGFATASIVSIACALGVEYDSYGRVFVDRRKSEYVVVYNAFGSSFVLTKILPNTSIDLLELHPADIPLDAYVWSSILNNHTIQDYQPLEEARGWPWLCFKWQRIQGTHQNCWVVKGGTYRDLAIYSPVVGSHKIIAFPPVPTHIVPLQPIWAGLILNTIVYGTLWVALVCGTARCVRLAMSSARRSKGRCPNCGYHLRGATSTRCPECGIDHA